MDEEEVKSPAKERLSIELKETSGKKDQPTDKQGAEVDEVHKDVIKDEKRGIINYKGKEVVLACNPLSLVDANSPNNNLLLDRGKVGQLAVRRVLVREDLKWKERFQNETYIVELLSDVDSRELSTSSLVKAKRYEGLLIEELGKGLVEEEDGKGEGVMKC